MTAESEIIIYIKESLEGGAVSLLRGYEPFQELKDAGLITPYWTSFRTMYTHGTIDPVYQMNEVENLLQLGIDNPQPLDPRDVLSEENAPDGWEIENVRFP